MDDKRVLTDEDIVRKLICNPACAPDSAVRAVLATLADYPERRRIIEDARRIERLVLERVGQAGAETSAESRRAVGNLPRQSAEPAAEPSTIRHEAFVSGAAWWEYESRGATMWGSDRDKAEAQAARRYGPWPAAEKEADRG